MIYGIGDSKLLVSTGVIIGKKTVEYAKGIFIIRDSIDFIGEKLESWQTAELPIKFVNEISFRVNKGIRFLKYNIDYVSDLNKLLSFRYKEYGKVQCTDKELMVCGFELVTSTITSDYYISLKANDEILIWIFSKKGRQPVTLPRLIFPELMAIARGNVIL